MELGARKRSSFTAGLSRPIFIAVFWMAGWRPWTRSLAHHADIGGTNPGTEGFANGSIFEEGLRLSSIRQFEGGVPVRDIGANIREPAASLGDPRS